jgi:hypothetical protein
MPQGPAFLSGGGAFGIVRICPLGGPVVPRYASAMTRLAILLRLVLALALGLTSAHGAMARAGTGGLTWIEICAGSDVTSVAVDADGNPATPYHPCPDCVVAAAALLPSAPVLVALVQTVRRVAWPMPARPALQAREQQARARGPPDAA